MKPKFLFLSALLLPFLASCEKELDFRYHDVESPLVIEAILDEKGSDVALTRTTPMDEPMNLTPLTDARVTLTDLTSGAERLLPLRTDGSFGDDIAGDTGHAYRIDVEFGGKTYSSTDVMRAPTEIVGLEFRWINMAVERMAVLQVSFTGSPAGDDNCYWVRLLRNGEPYKWMVMDSRHATGGVIHSVMMTSPEKEEDADEKNILRDGDIVSALVLPVSRDMLDYLMALEEDSNGPRMWTGDFCLGYFLAAPVAEASIVYRPSEITEFK